MNLKTIWFAECLSVCLSQLNVEYENNIEMNNQCQRRRFTGLIKQINEIKLYLYPTTTQRQLSGSQDSLEMSLESIAHSERTNSTQSSGERGMNSREERKQGRWMKGGGLRHRRAYNWRNTMKVLVFKERKWRKENIGLLGQSEIFIFFNQTKSPLFAADIPLLSVPFNTVWCCHDVSSQMVYLPRAFQTNQANSTEEIHHNIQNPCQCPVLEGLTCLWMSVSYVLLSCLIVTILVFSGEFHWPMCFVRRSFRHFLLCTRKGASFCGSVNPSKNLRWD